MILESVTILYYTLGTISIGVVLYQKYNNKIHSFINKLFYNYESVPNEEIDLNIVNNEINDNIYILFNQNEENNQNDENNTNQNNEENKKMIKTKKNIVIDFE
jgi:hypothetical protein